MPSSFLLPLSPIMSAIVRPLFPLGLDLVDQPVIVIGGRAEAVDKTRRLLAAQARVTVVSPKVDIEVQAWADAGRIRWRCRVVQPADLCGCQLVLNTLSADNPVHTAIVAWARRERVLICTYDQPNLSDIGMPAEIRRGHLCIAVATSNASPTVAASLRRDLERLIDDSELVEFLDDLGKLRQELRERVADSEERRVVMRKAASGVALSGSLRLPTRWRERLADMRRRLCVVRSGVK